MSMNLEILIDMLSPTCFEIVAQTHARVSYLYPRLMVVHFEEMGLRMNLENIVKLGRPICFEIVIQPSAWLLYSLLTQIFVLSVIVEKDEA